MIILKSIGAFFVKIWRWIKETAWVQPLLIVGAIFAVIFSIPYITAWANEWSGNSEGAFFADSRLSLEGETDQPTSNSEADRITNVIYDNMYGATSYEEVDLTTYGEKFYLVYHSASNSAATTAEDAFRELNTNWNKVSLKPSDSNPFAIYTIYASEESSNDDDYELTTNGATAFNRYLMNHADLFNRVGPSLMEAPYKDRAGLDDANYVAFCLNEEESNNPTASFPLPTILLVDFTEEAWDAGRFGISEVVWSLSGSTARENASTLIDMWNHLDPYSENNLFTLQD